MNIYVAGFRLHLLWFIIVHVAGMVTFLRTNIIFGILAEVVCMLAIYFLAQLSAKPYQYFFSNNGYSLNRIFIIIASIHLLVFTLLIIIISLFYNA